jgi:small subunit ribosomal protein S13
VARIAGIEIPSHKRVEVGLTYIFGIGRPKSRAIRENVKVDLNKKVKDLSVEELTRIRKHIKRLMDINCYRGRRHKKGLPVRGQRTKTNARTRKGPRGSMIKKKK